MSGITIDIYSDVVCPWCYIGKRRLERALSQLAAVETHVTWRPFQLNPTMPKEGMDRTAYLEAKFGSLDRFRRLEEQVADAAASEQISMALDKIQKTPNTLLAHRLIWYARRQGRQNEVVEALFKAYFEEAVDVGSPSELARLAQAAGVDAARLWDSEEGVEAVKQEEAAAHSLGIRAVPYFVLNNHYGISGAQAPEIFVRTIEHLDARQAEDQLRST